VEKILLVDDDHAILRMLSKYLCKEGFDVQCALNGQEAFQHIEEDCPDVILLDINLPDEDGLSIAQKIRRLDGDVGIMMVTGKKDVIDRVVGLEVGADDYLSKPFHLREVLARIRSILRRKKPIKKKNVKETMETPDNIHLETAVKCLRFSGWTVDLNARNLTAPDGNSITLTSGDFRLLEVFLKNPGRVLSRDQILDFVAARQWQPFDRSVDSRVRRLRRKIEKNSNAPQFIKTVRGEGYLFSATVSLGA